MFGVGAAEPALLQDYYTGTGIEFTRDNGGNWTTEEKSNLYNSQQGSLALVARNIQSLPEVENDTGNNFIDIDHWIDINDADLDEVSSALVVQFDSDTGRVVTQALDTESSPLLTYKN